jgi:hypothetical protein
MRAINLTIATSGAIIAGMMTVAIADESRGPAAQPAEPPVCRPVTSDLMNATIQPRHIKLWLAGKARNWEYAEYERHNIGGALARLAKAIPDYKGRSMHDLIAVFATPQLDALATAISTKDDAAFKTAYENLTAGCNQCHQATGHAMVVLQTPAADAFPDQVFQAPGH